MLLPYQKKVSLHKYTYKGPQKKEKTKAKVQIQRRFPKFQKSYKCFLCGIRGHYAKAYLKKKREVNMLQSFNNALHIDEEEDIYSIFEEHSKQNENTQYILPISNSCSNDEYITYNPKGPFIPPTQSPKNLPRSLDH